jgi:sugar lactone lactonase YvrE
MPGFRNRALPHRGAMLALGFACAAFSQPRHNLPVSLAAPDAAIDTLLTGLNSSGGIAADDKGNITLSEPPANRTWRLSAGGAKQTLAATAGLTVRGLAYDAQGRLFFCQDDKLSYLDAAGSVVDLATRRSGGGTLGHNNDLVVLDDGSVYFTLFNQPYALAAFDIHPDRTLAGKQVLATLGIPDGLALDALGNFYVTSLAEGCVAVYSPAAKELGRITFPGESIHNIAFGGRRNDTLYITGEHAAFRMPMKVAGQRDPFRTASALGPAPFRPPGRSFTGWPLPAWLFAPHRDSPLRDARGRLLPPPD